MAKLPKAITIFPSRNKVTRKTTKQCGICLKLTKKTPEGRRRRSGVFIVNYEHISHKSGVSIFAFNSFMTEVPII